MVDDAVDPEGFVCLIFGYTVVYVWFRASVSIFHLLWGEG